MRTTLQDLSKYIPECLLTSTLFCDNFQKLCDYCKSISWDRYLSEIPQLANIGPQNVPRTSPPASPGGPLKNLFDRTADIPIWRPGDVPVQRPGDVLKWRPGDVLTRRSRHVPGRLIRDNPRKFSGRPLEYLESTQTWMSKLFFQNLFDWPNLKAFQHSRCIENSAKLLRWCIFWKIS